MLRKTPDIISCQVITWNHQGRGEEQGHGTPDKDTERETKEMGYTRREMEKTTVVFRGRLPMLPPRK